MEKQNPPELIHTKPEQNIYFPKVSMKSGNDFGNTRIQKFIVTKHECISNTRKKKETKVIYSHEIILMGIF